MSRTSVLAVPLVLLAVAAIAALGGAVTRGGEAPRAEGSAAPASPSAEPAAVAASAFTPASFRFDKAVLDEAAGEPAAPVSLTASDGTGLRLVALSATGLLEPPLAFTELSLTFENPDDRVLEGRFRIALPPGAALSRFAMKIDGAWQEGEVVERQRARQAYEDFLHRRQDPALLEQEGGNEFSARVFPIPARGRKEIVVSYSHALARAEEAYVIPLLGLPQIGELDIRVLLGERTAAGAAASNLGGEVRDRRMVELHRRAWTPDRDFEVGQDRLEARPGLVHENLAVVRFAAPADAVPRGVKDVQEIAGLYVLVDSSASRALGYAAQVERLAELVAGLAAGAGGATPVAVAAFDQEVAPVYAGPASGFGTEAVARLGKRRALGASDLEGALAWLAGRLAAAPGKYPRVLLLTDGVATAGDTETRALRAAVRALGERGVERLDVLAVGGLRDQAVLAELVTGNLAHDGQRIEAAAPLPEIARRLTLACRSGIEVAVEGAAWVWPQTLDGVQPGDEVLVYADLPAGRPLRLSLGGRPVALGGELAKAERPLLERAWVQARIDRLLHLRETAHAGDEDLRRALVHEVVDLSVEHRVLSPYTALLVLETEADYARFGLDRTTLADILTVGPGGLDVLARARPGRTPAVDRMAAAKERFQPGGRDGGDRRDNREGRGSRLAEPTAPGDVEQGIEEDEEGQEVGAAASGMLDGVSGGVAGGVVGGVAGGVVGGPSRATDPSISTVVSQEELENLPVAGGVVGGEAGGLAVVNGIPTGASAEAVPPPPPPPALARPEGASESDAPLRVGEPRPSPRVAPPSGRSEEGGPTEEAIVVDEIPVGSSGRSEEKETYGKPYSGRFAEVMRHLAAGRVARARALAEGWNVEAPGDLLALVALGEAWEAAGDPAAAARAYGSLIDLYPRRADLRRYAGERLERLGKAGLDLAIDTYEKAVLERPDHPSGHRLLAWALLRAGRHQEAFEALETGLSQRYPGGRFAGVGRILEEDLGLLAAALLRAEPARREEVLERLDAHRARLASGPSLRFVLTWETDANDVDLHVYDRRGGHAYYQERTLPSGGELYDDVTTGYGPECFTVAGAEGEPAAPYELKAHYYSRGPMGYGMGILQVVEHDGEGRLSVEPRPFVVMTDQAMLDLGSVGKAKDRRAAARP